MKDIVAVVLIPGKNGSPFPVGFRDTEDYVDCLLEGHFKFEGEFVYPISSIYLEKPIPDEELGKVGQEMLRKYELAIN